MRSNGIVFLWLISLSIVPLSSTHVVKTDKLHSFYGLIVFRYVYMPHFLSPVIHQWTLGLHPLLFFTIVNHVATNMSVQISLSVLWDIYSEVEFLDHMVILFLILWCCCTLQCYPCWRFFLVLLSTNCQEWGTEFSNDCCWIFYFSFQFSQSFLHLLWVNR